MMAAPLVGDVDHMDIGEKVEAGKVPVVCISLARAGERRSQTLADWSGILGDHLSIFDAIDRRDLDEGRIERPVPRDRHLGIGRALTPGEEACVMSHITALGEWLPRIGPEGIVVMEDDVAPTDDGVHFFDLLAQARAENPGLEVIYMCKPWNPYGKSSRTDTAEVVSSPYPYGSTMIWRSAKAAQDYIERMSAYNGPADFWTPDCKKGWFGVMRRPVCYHLSVTTYIGNQHRGPSSHRLFKE